MDLAIPQNQMEEETYLKEGLKDHPTIKITDYMYGRHIQGKLYEIVAFYDGPENNYLAIYNVLDINKLTYKELIDLCKHREIDIEDIDYIKVAQALFIEDGANDDVYQFSTKEAAVEFAITELKFEI